MGANLRNYPKIPNPNATQAIADSDLRY